jgi:hypothetical protein
MTRNRTTIAATAWLQRPQGRLSAEEPRSHGGRTTALVIAALTILMMVAL